MQTGMPVVLDAVDHAVGDAALLGVEADDEAGVHEHAGVVDLVDAVGEVAARVLLLLRRDQGVGVGALDADEDGEEIRLAHHAPAAASSSARLIEASVENSNG